MPKLFFYPIEIGNARTRTREKKKTAKQTGKFVVQFIVTFKMIFYLATRETYLLQTFKQKKAVRFRASEGMRWREIETILQFVVRWKVI